MSQRAEENDAASLKAKLNHQVEFVLQVLQRGEI